MQDATSMCRALPLILFSSKVFCFLIFFKDFHLQIFVLSLNFLIFDAQPLSSLGSSLSMGSSLSVMISSCNARIIRTQKGKDSISIVDKITDAQLHEFHEAFSFFDKVNSGV